MKKRKSIFWFAVGLVACSLVLARAARKDEVTLVMVPREDATVQLGLDLAGKYPTLLISYKLGAHGAVSLHGWTGSQWVNITTEDFQGGNFFRTGPDSALIVEADGAVLPEKAIPPVEWCAEVSKIITTEMRPLIHLTGQYFDFPFKDWQWFARRYDLPLDAINPEGLNVSWYHKRLSDHFRQQGRKVAASDLQYRVSVRQPVVPEVEEPAPAVEEMEPEGDGDIGNPLTNEVPAAVVMGAADAPEEAAAEPVAAGEDEL